MPHDCYLLPLYVCDLNNKLLVRIYPLDTFILVFEVKYTFTLLFGGNNYIDQPQLLSIL